MPTLSLFNWAALVAAITVMGMAFILVPEAAWTTSVFLSIGLFVLAVAFLFYATSLIAGRRSAGDAGQLASISLVGVLTAGLLLLTAAAPPRHRDNLCRGAHRAKAIQQQLCSRVLHLHRALILAHRQQFGLRGSRP